jgi:hypothetical protein
VIERRDAENAHALEKRINERRERRTLRQEYESAEHG